MWSWDWSSCAARIDGVRDSTLRRPRERRDSIRATSRSSTSQVVSVSAPSPVLVKFFADGDFGKPRVVQQPRDPNKFCFGFCLWEFTLPTKE